MRGTHSVFAVIAMMAFAAPAAAVVVNFAADAPQFKEGCADNPAFCDLRIYQVMVESFVDGSAAHNYNAGYGTSHHKGDLRGIINSLDYIKGLGMNAIWMTPIFDSHAGTAREGGDVNLKLDATGYYARDYFKIDPKFGTLADAQELVTKAHEKGLYVFFDGVFGHHKGNLIPSPTGKLPVNSSPGVVNYSSSQSVEFYKEVATYWINQLGIDGWRLDQSYQVPATAWRQIRQAVDQASAQRAAAGHEWGTLGYMVAETWLSPGEIQDLSYGPESNPVLHSAFDFNFRYATIEVTGGNESGTSGKPASTFNEFWAYGSHDGYADHALPNLMIGNHDLVRFGDLLQRNDIANPADAEYWARHRLAFMVQGAYSGPITRYYGEEIGDELPGYADRVISGCANQGLCDDHVARTSAKILGVTVTPGQLSTAQHDLIEFHQELMAVRDQYPALSHGTRQYLYGDDDLYIDLKTFGDEEIVFAMNISNSPINVQLRASLFDSTPPNAWNLLDDVAVNFASGYLTFTVPAMSGQYILLAAGPTSGIDGDYNNDSVVDAADYVLWRANEGADAGTLRNDADGGQIGSAQHATWQAKFGAPTGGGGGSLSVPEPTAIALAAMLCAAPLPRLRRRAG